VNALRRFIAPALRPTMYNVVSSLHGRVRSGFHRDRHRAVMALSMGMLLGGVAKWCSQWHALRAEG